MGNKITSKSTPHKDVQPPVGEFVKVAGCNLLVHSEGTGVPAVVFLAGAGLSGLDYLMVQKQVSKFTTSIVYDRSGTGWSDATTMPITSTAVTDELKSMLAKLGITKPVVLVGHSLGGLYARHYAMRFPESVAGLVLLDPGHEDYDKYMPKELRGGSNVMFKLLDRLVQGAFKTAPTRALLGRTPVVKRYRELYRKLFTEEMSQWPAHIRDVLIERHSTMDWLVVGMNEARDIERRYAEVSKAGQIPDVPLIILSSAGRDGFQEAVSTGQSESLVKAEIEGKVRLYKDIAASVSNGEVRSVASGHVTIALRCPEEVTKAIRDVVHQVHQSLAVRHLL